MRMLHRIFDLPYSSPGHDHQLHSSKDCVSGSVKHADDC